MVELSMKLIKYKDGTFSIKQISRMQLAMLFHPHNIEGFCFRLNPKQLAASQEIYNVLGDGYQGNDFHKEIVQALKSSIQ